MIAFSIFRQLATFRPVGFLGQNSKRIGSIRRHNSSEISQIVPSGLRRGFRRTMAQSPVVMPGSGHCLLQAPSCKRCSAGSRIVTKAWSAFDSDLGRDLAELVREYHIPDFSRWKDHDSFEAGFSKLLKDLKAEESTGAKLV